MYACEEELRFISTGRSFLAPAPILKFGRNVLFTHAGSRPELSKIPGLYTLARRRNIDAQCLGTARHHHGRFGFEIARKLFRELVDRVGPQPCDSVRGYPQILGGIKEGIDSNSVPKSFWNQQRWLPGGPRPSRSVPNRKLASDVQIAYMSGPKVPLKHPIYS